MAPCCASPALTPHHRMATLNTSFTLSTTLCVPFSFMHPCLPYWKEALVAACYLLNRCPYSSIHNEVPYKCLYRQWPAYDHLRVVGCLCYPNLQATSTHKLTPRSTPYVYSYGIPELIKVIYVSTSPLIASLYLDTSSLTSSSFHLQSSLRLQILLPLTFWPTIVRILYLVLLNLQLYLD